MTFILTICTAGWIMCSSIREAEFKDYPSCAAERETIIKLSGAAKFNYITCTEKRLVSK